MAVEEAGSAPVTEPARAEERKRRVEQVPGPGAVRPRQGRAQKSGEVPALSAKWSEAIFLRTPVWYG